MSKKKGKGDTTSTPSVRVSNEPVAAKVEGPVIELALDKIRVDESRNLRKFPVSAQDIRKLADSIREQGLINPVIAYPVPENGDGATHQLEAGYQRVQALKLLAEEGHPVPIRATIISGPSEGVNLDENLQRTDLSPMDKAYILKEKVEVAGMKKGEAGKLLGMSPASVTRALALTTLRKEIQDKIHKGLVTARVMAVLPDLDEKGQDELLAELEDATSGSASEKAAKAKKKKGRKGKQGRKAKKSSEPDTEELYEAVEGQVGEIKAKEKATAPEKKALELYACLKGFLSGKMSMKALNKRVLTLVTPR